PSPILHRAGAIHPAALSDPAPPALPRTSPEMTDDYTVKRRCRNQSSAMRVDRRLALTIRAPPSHSRSPRLSPAKSQEAMAATTSSNSITTIACDARVRTMAYWTMALVNTRVRPTTSSISQEAASSCQDGCGAKGHSAHPHAITPTKTASTFCSIGISLVFLIKTLESAKLTPAPSPSHSAVDCGQGRPVSAFHSMMQAPESETAMMMAPVEFRRSPRIRRAKTTVHKGER